MPRLLDTQTFKKFDKRLETLITVPREISTVVNGYDLLKLYNGIVIGESILNDHIPLLKSIRNSHEYLLNILKEHATISDKDLEHFNSVYQQIDQFIERVEQIEQNN